MYLVPAPFVLPRTRRQRRALYLSADSGVIDLSTIDLRTGFPKDVPINPVTGCPAGVVGCKPIQQVETSEAQLPDTLIPPDSTLPPLVNVSAPGLPPRMVASSAEPASWWDQYPLGIPNKYVIGIGAGAFLLLLLRRR